MPLKLNNKPLKIFLTLSFIFVSLAVSAFGNRGSVDSLKTLVASSLRHQTEPDTLSINRMNKLAANYFESNPDSTLFYGEKGINLSRKINYQEGIANGLLQTGHANYFKGKFKQARKNFDEAVLIYKNLNDNKGLTNCYLFYGRMYNLLAKYKTSLDYINLAIKINNRLKDEQGLANSFKNAGIVYLNEGQLSTALDYFYKSLFIDIKLNNKLAAAANYNDIGEVLKSMEMYPKASEYYKKALKIFKESKDVQGVGTVYQNLGEISLAQKNYDQAITYISAALQIAIKQDDKEGLSFAYADLGLCYGHQMQYDKAISSLNNAFKIASIYNNVFNEAFTLNAFATVYNLKKDYKNAYKYAVNGQKMAVKLANNLVVRSDAALQLNKSLAGLGRYDEAYKLLRQYIDLKDSMNNNESIQKLTSYNLEFDFATKQRQLTQQHKEKDLLYQQRIKQQRLINGIFCAIIFGMIGTSVVYYRQKRKQQQINLKLEGKNKEVVQQKSDLDDQAQKLNNLNVLKDRLISVLAHDLRAPLSTLRGLFSLLQDESISHQQMLDMIPTVLKKLEYTSDFLDTLLFWINSQMDNFESSAKNFYVKEIVAYETDNYREQAALKGINIVDNVEDDVIALADPNSIRIVIRNLITNAIKFSKENDTIEIFTTQQDSDTHTISVKDTGTGMSDDQRNKLFKSKVNSKAGTNNESGTGMGMLFCKDLIEKCSGKIWVTSKQGEGTEFSFTIPTGSITEPILELVA